MKKPFLILSLFLISNNLYADDTSFLGQNSRWSIDAASTILHDVDSHANVFRQTIGLDMHKIVSNAHSDIGTIIFQPYLTNVIHSDEFGKRDDTKIIWRITNFNYRVLNQGRLNIRLGHFELPFGLEYHVDTNGTLRQLTSGDRGLKADWGISANGITPNIEYEVALTRGSGNEIKTKDNPFVFSGRVGTLSHKNLVLGFSWFLGDVLTENLTKRRKSLGFDLSYYYYQWQLMAETSIGEIDQKNSLSGLVEILWNSPRERLSAYAQLGYRNEEINYDLSHIENSNRFFTLGTKWVEDEFDFSVQYKHKFEKQNILDLDPDLSLQMRYRF